MVWKVEGGGLSGFGVDGGKADFHGSWERKNRLFPLDVRATQCVSSVWSDATLSILNYKSFEEFWRVKPFLSLIKNIERNIKILDWYQKYYYFAI